MKIEIRADNSVHIEGYVNAVERDSNIINVPSVGRCVEQIRAGVFDKALSSGADVSILENHDNSRRLGSISEGNLKLYEDNIGLRASADITDIEIVGKARRGELKGWSFGFICTDSEIEQRSGNVPRRIVKGLDLSEVSLIDGSMKPCYSGTSVEVRADGFIREFRAAADDNIEYSILDSADTSTDAENAPVDSTADGEDVETRSDEPDYSYYDAVLRYLELRYNPYHDPGNGRFTSGGGGGGGVMYVPNKKKGEKGMSGDGSSFYIGMSDRDSAEQALANEFEKWIKSKNAVPAEIQAKVSKVKEMTKKSPFGELQGDIKVTKDENGNYNLSYTQVKNYDRLKSATIGVGDIPVRKETTHTTYVLDNKGRRINTIRKTEAEYGKPTTASSDDWTGANANMGTSSSAKRKMSSAMKWADMQTGHRAEEDTDPEPV